MTLVTKKTLCKDHIQFVRDAVLLTDCNSLDNDDNQLHVFRRLMKTLKYG